MKKTIFILMVLAIAITIGALVAYEPGTVIITLKHWTSQTPVWLFALILLFLFFVAHGILRLIIGAQHLLKIFHLRQEQAHVAKAQHLTQEGFECFVEGHFKKAIKLLEKGTEHNAYPLINYLIIARATHALGDKDACEEALQQACLSIPHPHAAVMKLREDLGMLPSLRGTA